MFMRTNIIFKEVMENKANLCIMLSGVNDTTYNDLFPNDAI